MLAQMQEILKNAEKGGYAVGAFNTNNLEVTQAIAEAAEEMKSPVIIQTTPKAILYGGLEDLYQIVTIELNRIKVPGVLHLDHGKDFDLIREVIDSGYKSVMIDASNKPYEENVNLVERVVAYAHQRGVAVEAELGAIVRGTADVKSGDKTDPILAQKFVKETGIDSLAVSVGNAHGAPKGEELDITLLKKINQLVDCPLVLHGSSGLSTSDVKAAIKNGVRKINIDTNIKEAVFEAIKDEIKDNETDYRNIMDQARQDAKKVVMKYMRILNSAGKE